MNRRYLFASQFACVFKRKADYPLGRPDRDGLYTYAGIVQPSAQAMLITKQDVDVVNNGQPEKIPINSRVIYTAPNTLMFNNKTVTLANPNDINTHFGHAEDIPSIQDAANEVGLNESAQKQGPQEDFPVVEEK